MAEWVQIGELCVNLDVISVVSWYKGRLYVHELGKRGDEDLRFEGPQADALWHYLTETRDGTYRIPVVDDEEEA